MMRTYGTLLRATLTTSFMLIATARAATAGPLEDGVVAVERGDYATALQLLRPLAVKGDDVAQFDLGVIYDNGWGGSRDYVKATQWYRRAADQGNADAQYNLGILNDKAHRYVEAVNWYIKAADQGLDDAQYNLGILYENGHGVPRDYAEAAKWYSLAANQRVADAQYRLGILYANGYGVPQNYVQAFIWLSLSAAQDNNGAAARVRDTVAERMTPEQISEAQKLAREWRPK
jgi:uncharacterized protein